MFLRDNSFFTTSLTVFIEDAADDEKYVWITDPNKEEKQPTIWQLCKKKDFNIDDKKIINCMGYQLQLQKALACSNRRSPEGEGQKIIIHKWNHCMNAKFIVCELHDYTIWGQDSKPDIGRSVIHIKCEDGVWRSDCPN